MTHPRAARATVLATLFILAASAVTAQSLTLKTVDFESASVGRPMRYNIVLPGSYETSTRRYPVLYLLHGLTQNYTAWGLQNGTPFYAGLFDDLIVVMPDAGNSWYVNWV